MQHAAKIYNRIIAVMLMLALTFACLPCNINVHGEELKQSLTLTVGQTATIAFPNAKASSDAEYDVSLSNAEAVTVTPKDNGSADIVALSPTYSAPVIITITENLTASDTSTSVTFEVNVVAAHIKKDALTFVNPGTADGLRYLEVEDCASNDGTEPYILSDGTTGKFNYEGKIVNGSNQSLYSVRYYLKSSNMKVIRPVALSATTGANAFAYRITDCGKAKLTLCQEVRILSKVIEKDKGASYYLSEPSVTSLDEIQINVLYSDLNIMGAAKMKLPVGGEAQVLLDGMNTGRNTYKYTSSSKVATVDASGVISALKAGKTTVKVYEVESGTTLNLPVTVKAASITKKNLTVNAGTKVYNSLISNKSPKATYTFKSSKAKILTVNKYGVVTAFKQGSAKIKVYEKYNGKSNLIGTIKANVVALSDAEIDIKDELYKGADLAPLNTAVMTVNKSVKFDVKDYLNVSGDISSADITYKSSDTKVVTISNYGLVTAANEGSATISIKSGSSSVNLKINVITRKETDASIVSANALAAALSELAAIVDEDSYSAPTTFAKAKELSDNYAKAYTLYTMCEDADEAIPELDNLIPVPNTSLLKKAEEVLEAYFDAANASTDLRSKPIVSMDAPITKASGDVVCCSDMSGDVTFAKALSANDVLYYCYKNKLIYSADTEIVYEGTYDARQRNYVQTAESYGASYISADARDDKTIYVGVRDVRPHDASGNAVIRNVKQTITVSYIESVIGNAVPSRLTKSYLIDSEHFGTAIVDPAKDSKVVGNITPGEDIFIQDAVYENYGGRNQKNYFTYEVTELGAPEFTDTISYTGVLSGATDTAGVTLIVNGTKPTGRIEIEPVTYRSVANVGDIKATVTVGGYQTKV